MADITQLSDEELQQLANQSSQQPDITQLSDEELNSLAKQSQEQKQNDYINMRDEAFAKAHPVMNAAEKTSEFLMKGAPELLTGKSLTQRSQEIPISDDPNSLPSMVGGYLKGLGRDIAATSVDALTSPISLLSAAGKGVSMVTKPLRDLSKVSKETNLLKTAFGAPQKKDIPRKIGEKIIDTRKEISASRDKFDNLIQQEAETGSQEFQKRLPEYFKNNSKTYGNKLDQISEDLASNGESITRGEFKKILDDVISESQDDFLAAGKPFDEIKYLSDKYTPSFETGSVEANTFKGMQQPRWNENDPLNFKEVVNDIKNVKNLLSSKVKLGYKYTPEDVVAAKLMGRWGDFVETRVPEFAQLNQEYKPVIQAMKLAGKTFKPYASDFETKAGTQFLKNYAVGKLEQGQEKLLGFIEKGSENYPGVGNISFKIKSLGDSKIKSESDLTKYINDLMKQKSKVQDILSEEEAMKNKIKNVSKLLLTATGLEETLGPGYIRKKIFQ